MKAGQLISLLLAGVVAGCEQGPGPLPDDSRLMDVARELLVDTGYYSDVAIDTLVGAHYKPGEDRWQVIACYRYIDADGQGATCEDGFGAFKLHNGRWIMSVNLFDAYRWRELEP